MTEEKPRPSRADFVAKFKTSVEHAGHILGAQAAMGWMFRGDLAKARGALEKLTPEKLAEVSAAAAALSSLADEVAAGRSQP